MSLFVHSFKPSVVLLAVVVSSVSLVWSTRRLAAFSKSRVFLVWAT